MRYTHEPSEYKGYKYEPWVEDDGDVRKTFHDVHTPWGTVITMPVGPYQSISNHYFKLWIDAGCPYPDYQRLSTEDLEDIIAERILLGASDGT